MGGVLVELLDEAVELLVDLGREDEVDLVHVDAKGLVERLEDGEGDVEVEEVDLEDLVEGVEGVVLIELLHSLLGDEELAEKLDGADDDVDIVVEEFHGFE